MNNDIADEVWHAMFDALETRIGPSPILRLRTGAPPASPSAPRSGNVLSEMALPADWLDDAANQEKGLAGTGEDPAAAGGALPSSHYELLDSTGTTCFIQGLTFAPWQSGKLVGAGHQVGANGNIYRATVGGTTGSTAPSHASGTEEDGEVTWERVTTTLPMQLENVIINAGQRMTVSGFDIRSPAS